jgi:Na+-transporting NADH:ubiquinone oxidoreductase subunit NqrD
VSVLWQQSLVINLLPFELFAKLGVAVLGLGHCSHTGKPEVLQVQITNKIDLTIYTEVNNFLRLLTRGLIINRIRMLVIATLNKTKQLAVSEVVTNKKSVFFTLQPAI